MRLPVGDICNTPSAARSGSGSMRYQCATNLKIIDLFGCGFASVKLQCVLFAVPHGATCAKLTVVPTIDWICSTHASNFAMSASTPGLIGFGIVASVVDTTTTSLFAKPAAESTVTLVQLPPVIIDCVERSA